MNEQNGQTSNKNKNRQSKKEWRIRKPQQNVFGKSPPVNHQDKLQISVNENLTNCQEGDELKSLSRILQPNNDHLYMVYKKIFNDISNVLNVLGTEYHIHPFGSTISGLAFKGTFNF